MIQMKKYTDVKKTDKARNARQDLLNFYNELFNAEFFDEVSKHCFKKRPSHVKIDDQKTEKAKKQKINIF